MTSVAALLPAATDIVVALGAADRLVAVTHACAPPGGLPAPPIVTRSQVDSARPSDIDEQVSRLSEAGAQLFALDEAALASIRPGVILTQAVCDVCAVRAEDVIAVAERIIPSPRVVTLGASTVDAILQDVMTVGGALGLRDEAEELVAGLRARLRMVHIALKHHRAPRPRVAVIEWTDPPFAAGHWVPDMVRRAGGIEVLGSDAVPSRRVSPGAVQAANPEVIVVAPCGLSLGDAAREARSLRTDPAWRWAARLDWWAVDANSLTSSPGPAVIHGIEVLARVMHPDLFGSPDPASAERLA